MHICTQYKQFLLFMLDIGSTDYSTEQTDSCYYTKYITVFKKCLSYLFFFQDFTFLSRMSRIAQSRNKKHLGTYVKEYAFCLKMDSALFRLIVTVSIQYSYYVQIWCWIYDQNMRVINIQMYNFCLLNGLRRLRSKGLLINSLN